MIREIVRIDEEKCNGCGLCVPACAEGAIQIIDGKARLIADNLCDGLGACLGECPQDAISIERREADEFDEEAVEAHLGHKPQAHPPSAGGCPSAAVKTFTPPAGGCPSAQLRSFGQGDAPSDADVAGRRPSELRQWPVQLHLVPPTAPFLQEADVLLAADCVPFAYADFHKDLLKGKALLIACPKLDDTSPYVEKLSAMIRQGRIRSLTVAHMEVPCCGGLIFMARQAIEASGVEIPFETINIGIQGERK
ncbi:4Fe-4S binding protein [Geothermobacter ehrlichii]|uniref:4Fe-4S binding protein n=1 Tax=Geothermobacter ehrlichii TaxID=213224 RepID=A0A5D3WMK9_9BACT|nr:4Fe-4S binding protein [Geothermobacter ehrlichii]TYO99663.1 4Fe-4S binding protein [Geothermobacter ehrlichii]